MKEKKYKLTDDTIISYDHILHRIEAVRDFADVKLGDKGGYVESEDNLSHDGNCWVYDDARVMDQASVYGDASVREHAFVAGQSQVCGEADVFGNACVDGQAVVSGQSCIYHNAVVFENVRVHGASRVLGNSRIKRCANVHGNTYITDHAIISGRSEVYGCIKIGGHVQILGRSVVSGNGCLSGNDIYNSCVVRDYNKYSQSSEIRVKSKDLNCSVINNNDVLDNCVIIGQADGFDTEEFLRKFNSPFLRTIKH